MVCLRNNKVSFRGGIMFTVQFVSLNVQRASGGQATVYYSVVLHDDGSRVTIYDTSVPSTSFATAIRDQNKLVRLYVDSGRPILVGCVPESREIRHDPQTCRKCNPPSADRV